MAAAKKTVAKQETGKAANRRRSDDEEARGGRRIRSFRSKMLLPGITISTSADDFYPVEAMQMQKFDGKGWQRFGAIVRAESS
jgi:hypothetical protein